MKTSRFQRIRSGLARFAILPALLGTAGAMLIASTASAQLFTTTATTANWDSARWSTTNAAPFTTAWASGTSTSFGAGNYTFGRLVTTPTGTTTVGNITIAAGGTVGFTTIASTQRLATSGTGANITVGAGGLINFGAAGAQNPTAGTTAFFKNGAGALALSGGAYTGGFTLNEGLVVAGGANAFGTGAFTINGGVIGASANLALGVTSVAANGDFQVGSNSTLGGNSNTAQITISSGVVLGGTGDRTFTVGNNSAQVFSGVISGAKNLNFATSGTSTGSFTLSRANTYSGNTVIDATNVQVTTNATALSSGTVTLTGANPSQLRINSGLNLANELVIDDSAGSKTISSISSSSGATLSGKITNNDLTAGDFVLGAVAGQNLTVSGSIGGAGGLQVGNSTLAGGVVLSGSNSYSGSTNIDSTAKLVVGNNGAIRNDLNFSGAGTLDLAGFASTVNNVAGSAGTITSSVAGSALILGGDNSTSSLDANVVDLDGNTSLGVAIVKEGTGTLTLSGANLQYSALTTVNTGTVNALASNQFLGGVLVNPNGSLTGAGVFTGDMVSNGRIAVDAIVNGAPGNFKASNITINGAGSNTVLAIDSATNYSSLTTLGNLAYDGNLVIRFDNATTYADLTGFNLFNPANTPTGNFATVTTVGTGPYSGLSFTYDPSRGNWYNNGLPTDTQYLVFSPSSGTLVIVPEPSTWAMTLASVGFAGWMARRKKLASKKQRQLAA